MRWQWQSHSYTSKAKPGHRRNLEELSYSELIHKLDQEVSFYVRVHYMDGNMISCFTCGNPHSFEETDAGHYIPRKHLSVRFDLRNIRPQCRRCNRFGEGEHWTFRKNLVDQIGEESVRDLEEISDRWGEKRTQPVEELIELIKEYRSLNARARKYR